MITKEQAFDFEPQVTSIESGKEPSLRRIIGEYYYFHGGKEFAKDMTEKYIHQFIEQQSASKPSAQVPEGLLGVIERIEAVLCCPEWRCVSFANEHDNYEMSSALTDLRAMLNQSRDGWDG